MSATNDPSHLLDHAAQLVEVAKKAGADACDAVVVQSQSMSVSARLGKVEGTNRSESNDFSLRVFVGQKVASVSSNMADDPQLLAERAVAMAKVSPEDPFAKLADEALLAKTFPDLDLFDPTEIDADALREAALECEAAALDVKGVTNSGGASAGVGGGGLVLATSHGFAGQYARTGFSRSVSVVAGEGTNMQRDYEYDSKVYLSDLKSASEIGREAGHRTVERLNPKTVPTQSVPVLFDPRVSRTLLGHFTAAINGASIARKTSLLRDEMGNQVWAKGITITDEPHRKRADGSIPFDGEGCTNDDLTLVENGVLKTWLLDSATAKELELQTNARARRGGGSTSPATTNATLLAGSRSPEEMMRAIGTGFYVNELIGQGVNMVSGDYSRGASGFWIENGEIAFPVSEITIAGNLKQVWSQAEPASDLELKYATNAPSILIEEMTLAGR